MFEQSETLELTVRALYTFKADDKTVSCLLTRNVKTEDNPHAVNIVAILIVKINEEINLVKIVVGTVDPHDLNAGGGGTIIDPLIPDPQRTNELQNKQFRDNMRFLGIDFVEEPVIQIFNVEPVTGVPGLFRAFYSILTCAKISIIAFFSGEPIRSPTSCTCDDGTTQFKCQVISAFIQVSPSNTAKAVKVLRNLDMSQPFDEQQICINSDNIDSVCKCCNMKNKR